jgi:hypothetical protein
LAIVAQSLEADTWLALLIILQFFSMIADVPSDAYLIELSQIESSKRRGVILSTAQIIRSASSIFSGFIQAVLLNGPTTNAPGCQISFSDCWSTGLTVNQYYGNN